MRWTLVGRNEAVVLCETALADGRAGVELAGSAGAGKSRLLEEVLERADSAGRRVISLTASIGTREVPLGALSHIVRPSARLGEQIEEAYWRAGIALVGPGDDVPLIGVDDLQVLDDVSATVLGHLIRDGRAQAVFTRRIEDELSPTIADIVNGDLLEPVTVGPLSARATRMMAETILGGPLHGSAATDLWRLSAGNPLFIRELILHAESRGEIDSDDAGIRLRPEVPTQGRLVDIIHARLRRLDDADLHALRLTALAGPIGIEVIEDLCETDALENLERAGLIESTVDGRREIIRPGHPLYAETVTATMPRTRRRAILKELAVAKQARPRRRHADVILYVEWALGAGLPLDHDDLVDAAERALRSLDAKLAITFASAARERNDSALARLLLGEAQAWMGQAVEAEATLSALDQNALDDVLTVRRARAMAWADYQRADATRAFRRLDDAREAVTDDALKDALAVEQAQMAIPTGDTTWRDTIAAILDRGPERVDPGVFATAQMVTVAREAFCGQPGAGLARGTAIMTGPASSSAALPSPLMSARLRILMQYCTLHVGDARALYSEMVADPPPPHSPARASFEVFAGYVALHSGRPRTALNHLVSVLDRIREVDPLGQIGYALACTAEACAALGDREAAFGYVEEINALPAARRQNFIGETARAVGSCLGMFGEVAAAREFLTRGATVAYETNLVTLGAAAYYQLAMLGDTHGHQRLVEIADRNDERWVARAYLAHCDALARNDAAGLLRAAHDLSAYGRLMMAACAAHDAAMAFLADDDRPAAFGALLTAEMHESNCEGALNIGVRPRAKILTPREREIADLAVDRTLTAQQIAGRFGRSPRTVENQLNSIYRKLGVGGRSELAELVNRRAGSDSRRPQSSGRRGAPGR